jgi:hypothetical protein
MPAAPKLLHPHSQLFFTSCTIDGCSLLRQPCTLPLTAFIKAGNGTLLIINKLCSTLGGHQLHSCSIRTHMH